MRPPGAAASDGMRSRMAGKRLSNVAGFDDAPFPRTHRGIVPIVGTVYAGLRFDGVVIGQVQKDGLDAAHAIYHAIAGSRFAGHVQLILLQGIALGGFNVVDVFELEINGSEISPGYSELNDPVEQRRRFEQQLGDDAEGREDAVDEDFLAAMEHGMPPAGGAGVGIDRLLMLLLDAASIRDVILFPQLRPQSHAAVPQEHPKPKADQSTDL